MTQLIGQGTYGCIYYPEITCSGDKSKSKKLISKLQIDGRVSNNEIEISNIVKNIPDYKDYFAPIISKCPINVSKIKTDVTDCNALKGKKELVLMKMNYIKHVDLYDYLEHNSFFLKRYFNTFQYLLFAIQKLAVNNIVHYDMHLGNVVVNKANNLPIVFDFGLSINISKINLKKLSDYFFRLAPEFSIWCLEIQIINFFATIQEEPITLIQLKNIINEYVDKCKAFSLFNKSFIEKYRTSSLNFFEKYVGVKKNEVVNDLLTYYHTWDLFSLCLNYLKLIRKKPIDTENILVQDLLKILVININPNPTKRYSIGKTIEEFKKLKTLKVTKNYGFGIH
jgi:serine/threonine protein kinase